MSDPLSIAASIAGLLVICGKILGEGYTFAHTIHDCPWELPRLLQEVCMLNAVISQLAALSNDPDRLSTAAGHELQNIITTSATTNCMALLKEVEITLKKCQQIEGQRRGNIRKALLWPFKEREVKETITRLQNFRDHFCAGVTVDSSRSLMRIEKRASEIIDHQQEATRRKLSFEKEVLQNQQTLIDVAEITSLLQWISPLEPLKRHQDIQSTRVDNTGIWFLNLEKFQNWRDRNIGYSERRMLCCYGMPGAGKTVLSSLVVDHLILQFSGNKPAQVGVVCLYCDYLDQGNQTLSNILGCFLKQLLVTLPQIPDGFLEKVKQLKEAGQKPTEKEILPWLQDVLTQYKYTFVCLDALDELEQRTRTQLLAALVSELDNVQIFLTGRDHIRGDVSKRLNVMAEDAVEITAASEDIQIYLAHQIAMDENSDAMSLGLKGEIVATITEGSQGMFLLAALHLGMVLEKLTISQRRKALRTLPSSRDFTFEAMIERIELSPPSYAELGKLVLTWLHFAYRPLKLKELQHALAVGRGDTELDMENIYPKEMLLNSCCGLAVIDEETSTVRLVHYTLEEYLKQHSTRYFPHGCSYVAETCLIYLVFENVSQYCQTLDELKKKETKYVFLDYAVRYWGYHARQEYNGAVRKLTLKLLEPDTECSKSAMQLLNRSIYPWRALPERFPVIHAMAYFGMHQVMRESSINSGWNARDCRSWTPLTWAARGGHLDVVKLLLEHPDVDANSKDNDGWTPLTWAAMRGHLDVVKLLLEHPDVDANSRDYYGGTPLSLVARVGYLDVVKLFLKYPDVDANSKNNYDRTPLSWAAKEGHLDVVKLLLEHPAVDADSKNHYGGTPLSLAARKGHLDVVKLLLEHPDVDANSQDNSSWTPLSWAAMRGHLNIVKLLLEHPDVDANSRDYYGRTPLSWAARKIHLDVVKLLLEHPDVDANSQDNSSWTPLSWAAMRGHLNVEKLLLEHPDVDANSRDYYGRTPLSSAARVGYLDANSQDNYSWTPLSWAAMRQIVIVVVVFFVLFDLPSFFCFLLFFKVYGVS